MRKLRLLLIIVVTLSFFSCNDKNEISITPEKKENSISYVGFEDSIVEGVVWRLTSDNPEEKDVIQVLLFTEPNSCQLQNNWMEPEGMTGTCININLVKEKGCSDYVERFAINPYSEKAQSASGGIFHLEEEMHNKSFYLHEGEISFHIDGNNFRIEGHGLGAFDADKPTVKNAINLHYEGPLEEFDAEIIGNSPAILPIIHFDYQSFLNISF